MDVDEEEIQGRIAEAVQPWVQRTILLGFVLIVLLGFWIAPIIPDCNSCTVDSPDYPDCRPDVQRIRDQQIADFINAQDGLKP